MVKLVELICSNELASDPSSTLMDDVLLTYPTFTQVGHALTFIELSGADLSIFHLVDVSVVLLLFFSRFVAPLMKA